VMTWVIGGPKSLIVVFSEMDGEICDSIADQLAVFDNILSAMIVYVVNIDGSATCKRDFLHPLGTNLHPVSVKIDMVSVSHKFQFMMEDGRESTSRVHCKRKIWVEVDCGLVPDLIPFFWSKMRGRILSKWEALCGIHLQVSGFIVEDGRKNWSEHISHRSQIFSRV